MSKPQFNRAQSNVEDWLDGHYDYMSPGHLNEDKGTKVYPYTPKDPFRDHTPEPSDKSSSRSKGHKKHRSMQDHQRPATPPSEDRLERERARERERDRDQDRHHSHGKARSASGARDEREDRRPRHKDEAHYPPRADRGRPRRPELSTAVTAPNFVIEGKDRERHHHRRYSQSSSPPRHRESGKSSRQHSSRRHHEEQPSSRHNREASSHRHHDRDRDTRSHQSGSTGGHSSSSTASKARRPSLSHGKTVPPPSSTAGSTKSRRTSFSFLSDPRFTAAATAALQAGATAAVGAVGGPNAGAKVARAALGAAALGALRSPAEMPAPEERKGGDRLERRESTRRKR